MGQTHEVLIERFAHDGAGVAQIEGKQVRVFGMLPGEKGIIEVHKHKGIYLGELKELMLASPDRVPPHELHYLASSPWQIVSYPRQAEAKRTMLEEMFQYYDSSLKVEFFPADKLGGYRTKMEYCTTDRDIELSLAFHERGGGSRRIPAVDGSIMASERMNEVSIDLITRMRGAGYTSYMVKSVVVRESKTEGKCLALIYLKDDTYIPFAYEDIPGLSGLMIFFSTPKSPASVATKELLRYGDTTLTEIIDGLTIRYSWDSFFQNNISMFLKAVGKMKQFVGKDDDVIELYSGVGTIGLLLASSVARVRAAEIVSNAVDSATHNARVNQIENYQAECMPSEKIEAELIETDSTLVLDPPRSGLHPKLIATILEKLPHKIVYLSCNPETQSRDYAVMKEKYKIDHISGYDFYPQTPHAESLLVLSLR